MPAFTHLCEKIDVSLAHNTLTIYPKTDEVRQHLVIALSNPYIPYALGGVPLYSAERDPSHHLYHDDGMDDHLAHVHIRFPSEMTPQKLERLLQLFVNLQFMGPHERDGFLTSFEQAVNAYVNQFNLELANIKSKADEFTLKAIKDPQNYALAASASTRLYLQLKEASEVYFKNKTPEAYDTFKHTCEFEIAEARKVLENHREVWKPIMINIGAAIIGLGILYLLAASYNYYRTEGRNFFFTFDTDSKGKLDNLETVQAQVLRV